jgi:hypothetical protein
MNKHFEDSLYYLKRAGQTAKTGMGEEISGVESRVRELAGMEKPEPSRLDQLKADLADMQERAEGEAREAIMQARERLEEYRASDKQTA